MKRTATWADGAGRVLARAVVSACVCAAACAPPHVPAPYTSAEIEHALSPVRRISARCYDGSASQLRQKVVKAEFVLTIAADGSVRSEPQAATLGDDALIQCLRHGLDQLKFPPRERERLRVELELGKARPS